MRAEHLRVGQRRLDGEVFFQRDLALHASGPCVRDLEGPLIERWRGDHANEGSLGCASPL